MENSARQGFIFSPRLDLLVFLGPIVMVALGVLALYSVGLAHTALSSQALYFYAIFFNTPHVFSTALRTYLDPEERERLGSLLWMIPLFSFAAALILQLYFPRGLLYLAAYGAMFHHLRQQYGLMMIAAKKSGASARDLWWDKLLIYGLTFFCLLRLHSLSDQPFWFDPGDMWAVKKSWATISHFFLGAIFLAYYGRLLSLGQWAWGKQLVVLSTVLSWYVSVSLRSLPLAVLLLGLNHNITYLFFIFHYQFKKHRENKSIRAFFFASWGMVFPWALLVFLGVSEEWIWTQEDFFGNWSALIVALLYVPQLTHYGLDTFIWRGGHYQPFQKKTVEAASTPLKERFKAWAYPLIFLKKTRSPNSN